MLDIFISTQIQSREGKKDKVQYFSQIEKKIKRDMVCRTLVE